MCDEFRRSSIRAGVVACYMLYAVAALATGVRAADEPVPRQQVLHLTDGRTMDGEIRNSSESGVLRYKAATGDAVSDIPWKNVAAIYWPPPAVQPKTTGDFRFELAGGDVVFGSLVGLGDKQAELDIPRLGRIHVRRGNLHRIDRWRDSAEWTYFGPNGLAGWNEPAGEKKWRDDSGRPATDSPNASIRGQFGVSERTSIEFEISWKSHADFVFAVGVGDTEESVKRAFRFEVWGSDLIIQRELQTEADLHIVHQISPGPGRVHLEAYLDQKANRLVVLSPRGENLGELTVGHNLPALPGLYMLNEHQGDVRLEWLRIGPWRGDILRDVRADQTRIDCADGSNVTGALSRFEATSKEFVLKSETGELRVPMSRVSSVLLSAVKVGTTRRIRAVDQDGSRVSGEPVDVKDGALFLKVPGIEETLRVSLGSLRTLVVLRQQAAAGK
jgi:hypothetical protein